MAKIWLRRGDPATSYSPGKWWYPPLSAIGNAAARETFVTQTSHMAAIWTDLFQSMIVLGGELRWRGDGPGIGRDARTAYSSLLGRYMARAYLAECEGVGVLVPLDVAKRQLLEDGEYFVAKDPPSNGYEADWIGLDRKGLVIVEAKGTFDEGKKPWHGRSSTPKALETAIGQAERTAVFRHRPYEKLPAKRWAIASRWGTETNGCVPTLLAWDPEQGDLPEDDYQRLGRILHGADVDSVIKGLGYSEAERVARTSKLASSDFQLQVGLRHCDPGLAAIVGPLGVRPLRDDVDIDAWRRSRDAGVLSTVATLSDRYASDFALEQSYLLDEMIADERSSSRNGLTVIWPTLDEDIQFTRA